jgi:hypothetical protein
VIAGAVVSKPITIEQVVHALQRQNDSGRVLVTYDADAQHHVQFESMDVLYVIMSELAAEIEENGR